MNSTAPNNREKEIFEQALDLESGAVRQAFVKGACGEEAALCARLLALLAAHETDADFLPDTSEGATVVLPVTEKPGDCIGRYKLREKIGEGGCGLVYVAEQEEPVRRKVALKVIKLGMDTREVVARFEVERQALAMMDHPNIAKVLDAGATETGRPYFVMELVRGIRITDYCDQNKLSTQERLDLFIRVCHAIQHAHQKGIIHRDIKPSNVLVTLHDGVPVPKVIDFGIAKAMEQRLTEKTVYTAFEQFIGTPAYTSPEQAEMSGLDIDTRSDIYALGVLLYELLTGKTPFDGKELLASELEAMRRTIREKEPVRPSTRLRTMLAGDLTTTAQQRRTEAPRLIHLLRGDLDWIVMKCLEKDRTRRYDTATGLAQDIQHHLNSEPVAARPPSTAYRVQKLVRRNKMMVAAGSAVVAALVLGIVVSTWQAVRAGRQRARAEANEQKALAAEANESQQRQRAEEARQNEAKLRKQAQAQAYASDMKAAQVALHQNNRGMTLRLLRQYLPEPGEEDLRGLEWRYLWRQCQADEYRNFPHPAMVYSATLSSDGRYLATACHDNKVRVWEAASGRQIQEFEAQGLLAPLSLFARKSVGFSPNGKWLAALGRDGVEIRVTTGWRVVKELRSASAPLCFSADGRTLVTGGTNGMLFWDPAGWTYRVLTNVFVTGNNFALTPDGNSLARFHWVAEEINAMMQSRIEVCDVRTGSRRAIEETPFTTSLAISLDGKWLAYGNQEGEICHWDLTTWLPTIRFRAHHGPVSGLAFSPDGKRLASGGSDQQILFWETGTTNLLGTRRGHLSRVWSLEFSSDGRKLASASMDGTAKLWTTGLDPAQSQVFSIPTNSWIISPLPDGSALVTVDYKVRAFHLWRLPDGELIRTMRFQELDPQGQGFRDVLGAANYQSLLGVTTNGAVHLFNPSTGALLRSVQLSETNFTMWSLSPDQRWLLALSSSGDTGILFDLLAASAVRRFPDYAPAVNGYATFSPDSRWLAYATTNHVVKLWDLAASHEIATLKGPSWWLLALAFSPDGKLLAGAGADERGWLWSVDTAKPLFDAPLQGDLLAANAAAFSSDNRTLATFDLDRTLRWWSVATGREMLSFQSEPWWGASYFDFPAPGNGKGRLLLFYERPGHVRVMMVPSLAEIDAAELQTKSASESH